MVHQQCACPRGKALGGGTTTDYMIHHRGFADDYDQWAEMGLKGWSYNDVLPLFRKHERANIGEYSLSEYHNKFGELSVKYPRYRSALVDFYMMAVRELGHSVIDYNGEDKFGTAYAQIYMKQGKRMSVAKAFITPILAERQNLHVLTNTLVTRILIDKVIKTAYGVTFYEDDIPYKVHASKEVIVSAGTFNSAQLLMLSGIGPKNELQRLDIPCVADLPVGQTLYDSVAVLTPPIIMNTTTSPHWESFGAFENNQFISGRGILTHSFIEVISFLKSSASNKSSGSPDLSISMLPGSLTTGFAHDLKNQMNLNDDIYNAIYRPLLYEPHDIWSGIITNLHANSKGTVKLKNAHISTPPIINYPYFNETQDLDVLVDGLKQFLQLIDTSTMQHLGAIINGRPIPQCGSLPFGSDDYWCCYVRHMATSFHNQVGTNRMGLATDPESVVDAELKVHGIEHLRVADMSVVPTPVTGKGTAISAMIGEKLARDLTCQWTGDPLYSCHKEPHIFPALSDEQHAHNTEKVRSTEFADPQLPATSFVVDVPRNKDKKRLKMDSMPEKSTI